MNRRDVLCSSLALLASPVLAERAPFRALADYERGSGGHIGVYGKNLKTGAQLIWRAHERFVMCSSFKASLAGCILTRVDRGEARMDEMIAYGPADLMDWAPVAKQNLDKGAMSVADMCAAAVELSDNTCANALLARFGGPAALTAFWRSLGDTVSRLDHNEPQLNGTPPGDPHDTTTPAAMSADLQKLVLGKGALAKLARAPYRLDAGLQDWGQPIACRAAEQAGASPTRPATMARMPPATSL